VRIALHQPDIAGNVGTILRLAACLGVPVDIVEPCGFPLGDRTLKRAAMDYGAGAEVVRHVDFPRFHATLPGRLVLLTTRGATGLPDFAFHASDTLLMGSEGAGVPDAVHDVADARVAIPMRPGFRSLNIAVATAIALGEALRQTGGYPT
jgi:tRNA (cytidine/uridine-2'-O-)-methyltransferase